MKTTGAVLVGMGAIAGALLVSQFVDNEADAARRNRTFTFEESAVRATHGRWNVSEDGGMVHEVFFIAPMVDAGVDAGIVPVPMLQPFGTCTGGFTATTLSQCRTDWNRANGL